MPAPSPYSSETTITVSIVSHGHGAWLASLLPRLADTGAGVIDHVVVTHNVAGETPTPLRSTEWPFRITEITNAAPQGFGANHNRAFSLAKTRLFCVLNPDISLPDASVWRALATCAAEPGVGCAYPVLLNVDGSVQDSVRQTPTPWALVRRRLFHRVETRADWISGAFWVIPSDVFQTLGGFDTRYFLYCEDVDFCLRLQLRGQRLEQVAAHAVHHAQRSSHRRWRHLAWHLSSLWRLWTSAPLWAYLRKRGFSSGKPAP